METNHCPDYHEIQAWKKSRFLHWMNYLQNIDAVNPNDFKYNFDIHDVECEKQRFLVITDEKDIYLYNPDNWPPPEGFRRVWLVDRQPVDDEVGRLLPEFWSLKEITKP